MFKKLFERFTKKTETKLPDNVTRIEVSRAKVDRVRVDRTELDESSALVTKFRDTNTGEIVKVAFDDHEKFRECMSNKNMQIIFG